jgi:Skp family chaperone for outer membrane proteins
LKIEEQALTDQRASLSPADFRVLADAFDKKVEKIRTEQAQKSLALNNFAEAEQQRFFKLAFPVLVKLANELSAVAILDERSTIIASEQMDITALAVTRVNAAIGDGSDATQAENP